MMVGVSINKKGTEREEFVAEMTIDGVRYRRSFSVNKFGKSFAMAQATLARRRFEELSNSSFRSSLNKEFMCKVHLLDDICSFYGYALEFSDKIYYYIDAKDDEDYSFQADTIDEALCQWLETLEETNACDIKDGVLPVWESEVAFIKRSCR